MPDFDCSIRVEIQHSLHGVSIEQATIKAPKDVLGKLMFSVIGLQSLVKFFFLPCSKFSRIVIYARSRSFLEKIRHGFRKNTMFFDLWLEIPENRSIL